MNLQDEIDGLFGPEPYPNKETRMTEIVKYEAQPLSLNEVMEVGEILARSGFFAGIEDTAQAVAKILFGQEIGLGPTASLRMIHTFPTSGGKMAMVPHYTLILALLERSDKYDYRVLWSEDEKGFPVCTVEFYRHGELRGEETVDRAYAIRAALINKPNWANHLRDMLFATAVQKGARKYAPDVAAGFVTLEGEGEFIPSITVETTPPNPVREAQRFADEIGMPLSDVVSRLAELGFEDFDTRRLDEYRSALQTPETEEVAAPAESPTE